METIGKIKLKNKSGCVVKLEFEYYNDQTSKWEHVKGTGDITAGFDKTAEPGDYNVPDGASVRLFAFVVWGSDNIGQEMFTYKKGNKRIAQYNISGTTLSNSLEFIGILDPAE